MLKKIKKMMKRDISRGQGPVVKQKDLVRERVEEQMVAASFAEAGLTAEAQDILREGQLARRKVLVVGREDRISDAVMHYAVGFAERMGYEIVALNVVPLPRDLSRTPAALKSVIREYERSCAAAVKKLQDLCKARGVTCTHIFKTGSVEDAVREVHREIKRIEFVISEHDVPEDALGRGETWVIPVYSLAH
ncbi:MAG: universal stress protein [Desulfosoma sp.]|uniref:universal stress protein n=1 Tax=Desulfosoma sp. TaxID=2603217 RepID=UPI00404B4436